MKVESYKIKGWKGKERGLLIDENEDWILVKHIPIDYVVDGYKIYKKSAVKKRKSKAKEAKIAKVLKLKNTNVSSPNTFNFSKEIEILEWSEKQYGLFEFQTKKEESFYGKIHSKSEAYFTIDAISPEGNIEAGFSYDFKSKDVIAITVESDYFDAIRLLMNDHLSKKTKLKKVTD